MNREPAVSYKFEFEKAVKENQNLKIQMKKMIETIENLSSILSNKEDSNGEQK